MQDAVVILSRARTPIGSFLGSLSSLTAPQLGSLAIGAALERSGVNASDVSEVIMGEVLSAAVGQAPARQAALGAGLPSSVPCTTINKVCGSGLKAVMLANQSLALGDSRVVVAGGMESMSNAPYALPKARQGFRMGNAEVLDTMLHDGLFDPYNNKAMGTFGDQCSSHFSFTREAEDAYAKESYERALHAQKEGYFKEEIVSITLAAGKGSAAGAQVSTDEEPSRYNPEKMQQLKPAFSPTGTVTAANASKVSDGAAALVLSTAGEAERRGIKPLARIVSQATFAQDPAWFTTARIGAIQKALALAKLSVQDIDLFEINEAFSNVPMAAMKELGIARDRLNVWGGAVSLGHPIGCSGARVLCTLLSAMIQRNARLGCAALCLGGGEAVAMVVSRV